MDTKEEISTTSVVSRGSEYNRFIDTYSETFEEPLVLATDVALLKQLLHLFL
jgi:hypothetical protein